MPKSIGDFDRLVNRSAEQCVAEDTEVLSHWENAETGVEVKILLKSPPGCSVTMTPDGPRINMGGTYWLTVDGAGALDGTGPDLPGGEGVQTTGRDARRAGWALLRRIEAQRGADSPGESEAGA